MHQSRIRVVLAGMFCLWALTAVAADKTPPAAENPALIKVMVVGVFHFDNPGLDYRNVKVDNVLAPGRQKEIKTVVDALATFKPTLVGLEWRDEVARASYAKYRAGSLPPDPDESVQLGFRLAKQVGLPSVRGMDSPMGLPFDPVLAYAKSHGQQSIIDEITRVSDANVAMQQATLKTRGIAATLRWLNDPQAALASHGLYREILKIGSGADQPGVAMTTKWYERNIGICANLLQAAKPGDRVIIFFGAGHLPLLRQCVQESPGYELVDALDFLP